MKITKTKVILLFCSGLIAMLLTSIIFNALKFGEFRPRREVEFKLLALTGNKAMIEANDPFAVYLDSEKVFSVDIDGIEYISQKNPEGKYFVSLTDAKIKEIVCHYAAVNVNLFSNSDIRVTIPIPFLLRLLIVAFLHSPFSILYSKILNSDDPVLN